MFWLVCYIVDEHIPGRIVNHNLLSDKLPQVKQKRSRKSSKRELLISHITALSVASDWHTVRQEWDLVEIYVDPDNTCVCSHFPIKNICVIRNRVTDEVAEVGNCCAKNFESWPTDTLFGAVKRIYMDRDAAIADCLSTYCAERRIITEWEYGFCLNTSRKRRLSDKQSLCRRKINERVISRLMKSNPNLNRKIQESAHATL